MGGIEDRRSPLQKALGERVPCKVVTVEKGRLAGVPMALRALSQDELQRARRTANERMTEVLAWKEENLFTDAGIEDTETEYATQVLALALIVPPSAEVISAGAAQRLTKDADELRLLLTKGEVALLWRIWCDYEIERSPLSAAPEWSAVEAVLDALGKAQVSSYCLHGYDTVTLRFIVTEQAVRLCSKRTSSPSSDTSPSSESGSASSDSLGSPTTATMTVE